MQTRTQFFANGLVPVASIIADHDECPMCIESPTDPVALQPCSHIFCRACIKSWLSLKSKNTCPSCRKVLFAVDDADRGPI